MRHERFIPDQSAATAREQTYVVIIAVLAALLIAASNVGQTTGASLLAAYVYWIVRVAIEGTLFLLVRDAVDRYFAGRQPVWVIAAAAIGLSLVPFVLAITALDIILGYPELGAENAAAVPATKLWEFAKELFYLLDNHVFLCSLLTIPRLLLGHGSETAPPARAALAGEANPSSKITMFAELDPPLKGAVLWAEAQEHYVRLTTSEESRMLLNRFKDVLRDLPSDTGIQVHRSHWVSIDGIKDVFREGPNLRIRLQTNDVVPVSRSYRAATERRLKEADLLA